MERAQSCPTSPACLTATRRSGNPFARLLGLVLRLDQAYRDRRAIEHLDAHLRRDIGLDDNAAPRWNAPEYMRRK